MVTTSPSMELVAALSLAVWAAASLPTQVSAIWCEDHLSLASIQPTSSYLSYSSSASESYTPSNSDFSSTTSSGFWTTSSISYLNSGLNPTPSYSSYLESLSYSSYSSHLSDSSSSIPFIYSSYSSSYTYSSSVSSSAYFSFSSSSAYSSMSSYLTSEPSFSTISSYPDSAAQPTVPSELEILQALCSMESGQDMETMIACSNCFADITNKINEEGIQKNKFCINEFLPSFSASCKEQISDVTEETVLAQATGYQVCICSIEFMNSHPASTMSTPPPLPPPESMGLCAIETPSDQVDACAACFSDILDDEEGIQKVKDCIHQFLPYGESVCKEKIDAVNVETLNTVGEQVYECLFQTASQTTSPGMTSPETTTPSPKLTSPVFPSPEISFSETLIPEITSQETTTQEFSSQETTSQELTSEITSQELTSPETASQELTSPNTTSQEVASQETTSQEFTSPETTSRELTSSEKAGQELTSPEMTSQELTSPVTITASQKVTETNTTSREDLTSESSISTIDLTTTKETTTKTQMTTTRITTKKTTETTSTMKISASSVPSEGRGGTIGISSSRGEARLYKLTRVPAALVPFYKEFPARTKESCALSCNAEPSNCASFSHRHKAKISSMNEFFI